MDTFIIAIAVSIDGMLAGLALGLRRVRIPLRMLFVIMVATFLCVFVTMALVRVIFSGFANDLAAWIGGILLMVVGLMSLKNDQDPGDAMRACTFVEAVIVGLGVAIDASIASASLALDGAAPLSIAALMAFTHFILVWLGNLAGRKGLVLRGLALKIVPAAILFILGFMRLPFVPV